jgi:hypothetical protein
MSPFHRCRECGLTNFEHTAHCPADPCNQNTYFLANDVVTPWRIDAVKSQSHDAMTPRRRAVEKCAEPGSIHALGVRPTPTPFNSGLYRDSWGAGGSGGPNCSGQLDGRDAIRDALEQALANPVEHPKSDPINPSHYKGHPSGVQCVDIAEHMGFNLGNALKYMWRADLKGDPIENLEKSIWYIQREIAKRRKAAP